MSDGFRVIENTVYKTVGDVELALDCAVDDKAAPAGNDITRPIVLIIHGGAWLSGDRAGPGTRVIMRRFAEKGFLVSSISYRLSSGAIFPAQLQDVWDAVRWLRDNASRLGADARAVGAMGHSAGGHLAALLGLTWDRPELGGDGIPLKAVIPIAAPAVLAEMPGANDPNSPEALLIGGPVSVAPEAFAAASPVVYAADASSGHVTKFLIIHGERDQTVPISQGRKLHDVIPESTLIEIGNGDHDVDTGDIGWLEIIALGTSFFEHHLR